MSSLDHARQHGDRIVADRLRTGVSVVTDTHPDSPVQFDNELGGVARVRVSIAQAREIARAWNEAADFAESHSP